MRILEGLILGKTRLFWTANCMHNILITIFWGTPVCFGQQTACTIYLLLYSGEHPFVLDSKLHAQYTYYCILGNILLFWTANYMHNILITVFWGTPVCFGQQTACTIYLLLYFGEHPFVLDSKLHAQYTCYYILFWRNSPQWAMASSFMRFLDHTQRPTTVGRTPPDE